MTPSKTDKQRESTVIRKDVVIELRGVRKEYPDSSRFFQLWRASLERMSRDLGITRAEVAAGFYPKTFEQNYDRALYLAKELIAHFQRWKRNKAVVLKAERDPGSRIWYYYNLKKPNQKDKIIAHKKQVINGLLETDKRDLEILMLHPKRRRKLIEIMLTEEALAYGYTG